MNNYMQENTKSENNFVTVSDQLVINLTDKIINFINEKRKEELAHEMELEKLKIINDKDIKLKLLQTLRDSKVLESLMGLTSRYLYPNDVSTQKHTEPRTYDLKKDLSSLRLIFNIHKEKIRPNLTEKTFEYIKNIFESENSEQIKVNITLFKAYSLDVGNDNINELSYLTKYYVNELDENEKFLITKYIGSDL